MLLQSSVRTKWCITASIVSNGKNIAIKWVDKFVTVFKMYVLRHAEKLDVMLTALAFSTARHCSNVDCQHNDQLMQICLLCE